MDIATLRSLELLGYYGLAYLITGILGFLIVTPPVRLLVAHYLPHDASPQRTQLSALAGICERIIYISAVLLGRPEVIAA
jgi:hypothetical protein